MRQVCVLLALIYVCVCACNFLQDTQTENLQFVVAHSKLPVGIYLPAAVYDGDDTVYVIGGHTDTDDEPGSRSDQIIKYNLRSGDVGVIGTFKNVSGGAVLMDNGDIIYIGGYSSTQKFSDIDRISTANGTWTRVNSLPEPAGGFHSAVDHDNGVVYLVGGIGTDYELSSVLAYNIRKAVTSHVGRLPEARSSAAALWHAPQQLVYIFGGYAGSRTDDVLTFSPGSGEVVKLAAKLPRAPYSPKAVYVEHNNNEYTIIILDDDGLVSFNTESHVVQQLEVKDWPQRFGGPAIVYVHKMARVYLFGGTKVGGYTNEISYISFIRDNSSTSSAQPTQPTTVDPVTYPSTSTGTASTPPVPEDGELQLTLTSSRLPVGLFEHTAIYDGDDGIFLIGGFGEHGQSPNITRYTLSTGAVEVVARYKPMVGGAAFMSPNGDLIHIGGKGADSRRVIAIDRISMETGTWTRVTNLPEPADSFRATWDRDSGVAYLFGGLGDAGYLTNILMYNSTNDELTQVGSLAEGRMDSATTWDSHRKLAYIFGEFHTEYPGAKEILSFDPASGQVTKLSTQLPNAVRYRSAVYVEYTRQAIVIDTEGIVSFDPDTQIVRKVSVDGWPVSLHRPAVVYVPKLERMYIFGGRGSYNGEAARFLDEISYISFGPGEGSTTQRPPETTTTIILASSTETSGDLSTIFPTQTTGLSLWAVFAIATGGALLIALLTILMLWLVYKRRERALRTPTPQPSEGVAFRLKTILNQFRTGEWPKVTEFPVDDESPTNNCTTALTSAYDLSRYEIPNGSLRVDKSAPLGSGQFGSVFRGTLTLDSGSEPHENIVAVKKLKVNNYDSVTSFLKELKLMIQVGPQDNVIRLLGACTGDVDSLCLVLEYCQHGSLRNHLVTHREEFEESGGVCVDDLLRWTLQMAAGMEHLAARKVIHGDLALRNVLLDGNRVAKVSDFGLGARLYEYALYVKNTEQKLLPWRWMAPETLTELRFSYASDVWAFGVTTWELYSLARVPYPGIGWAPGFVEQLLGGYRNSRPEYANEEVYSVMMSCWAKETRDRPSMTQIKERLMLLVV